MRMHVRSLAVPLLLAGILACGDEPASAAGTLVPALDVREDLRVGSADDPETSLTRLGGLAVGRDGRMYTLHPAESRVRVHAADGTPLPSIGRSGRGPGEFSGLYRLGFVGDTLWVVDFDSNRLSHFSPDGEFLSDLRILGQGRGVASRNAPRVRGRFADGTIEAAPMGWLFLIAAGIMTEQPILRLDTTGRVLDTLGHIPLRNSALTVGADERGPGSGADFMQPFSDDGLLLVDPSGAELVHVDRTVRPGAEASFRLTRLTTSGDTLFTRRYPYQPRPIPDQVVDSIVRRFGAVVVGDGSRSRLTPAAAEAEVREKLYRPAHLPTVTEALLGRDGTIWLRRELAGDPAVAWLVVAPDGEPLGTATLPRGFRLLAADASTAWGMETDDLDVPYLVRYRVGAAAADSPASVAAGGSP